MTKRWTMRELFNTFIVGRKYSEDSDSSSSSRAFTIYEISIWNYLKYTLFKNGAKSGNILTQKTVLFLFFLPPFSGHMYEAKHRWMAVLPWPSLVVQFLPKTTNLVPKHPPTTTHTHKKKKKKRIFTRTLAVALPLPRLHVPPLSIFSIFISNKFILNNCEEGLLNKEGRN